MAGRILELAISIKGKLEKAYTESMRKAASEAEALQKKFGEVSRSAQDSQSLMEKLGDLKGLQASIQRFRDLKQAAADTGARLTSAQADASKYAAALRSSQTATEQLRQRHDTLAASMQSLKGKIPKAEYQRMNDEAKKLKTALRESEAATKSAGQAFEHAKNQAASLKRKLAGQQEELQRLRTNMASAGYATNNLAQNEIRLRQEIQKTTEAQERAAKVEAQVRAKALARRAANEAHNNAQQDYHNATENLQNTWYFAKDVAAPFIAATKSAMQFQSAMADVRKVVDFDTPEQFKEMGSDILRLTRTLPMAAEDLAKIVAAGGQSGIARGDLLAFAESAAKMGVAFDITADQAGEMMAKWRTAFKLSQDDVVKLADQINYLGNTTAASAPLISDVVTRIGPLGEIGGVASGEIAALGASMLGAGGQTADRHQKLNSCHDGRRKRDGAAKRSIRRAWAGRANNGGSDADGRKGSDSRFIQSLAGTSKGGTGCKPFTSCRKGVHRGDCTALV